MTPEQTDLIRSSFAQVLYKREEAGQLFYERLFAIAPETRPLFNTDIVAQSRKLMDTLAAAVNLLRDMPRLVPVLQDLGRRHRTYGVKPVYYAKVGEALLWTLEDRLGPAFDAKTRAAWTELYGIAASAMEPATAKA